MEKYQFRDVIIASFFHSWYFMHGSFPFVYIFVGHLGIVGEDFV